MQSFGHKSEGKKTTINNLNNNNNNNNNNSIIRSYVYHKLSPPYTCNITYPQN
jgi:hypothetical protein